MYTICLCCVIKKKDDSTRYLHTTDLLSQHDNKFQDLDYLSLMYTVKTINGLIKNKKITKRNYIMYLLCIFSGK